MKRAFVITASGIGGGQVLVLLVTPLLARIYSPAEFGVYASVISLASVLATISAMRFDAAIPAVEDGDVRPLFLAGIVLPLIVCPLALVAFEASVNLTGLGASFLNNIPIQSVLFIAVFQSMVSTLLAYCTRIGWFGKYALIRLLQPSAFGLLALFSIGPLEFSAVLGWIISLSCGMFFCRSEFLINMKSTIAAMHRAWRYPAMSAPMSLLDSLSAALPVISIISMFGSADAGSYSQVQRLIGAPLVLAGLAVAQVFYKYAGDQYRNNLSITLLFWRVVGGLSTLGIALLAFSVIAGEFTMGLILGQGWRVDTWFVTLTLIPVVARSIASPVSTVFLITNRIGILSIFQTMHFFVTLVAVLYAKYFLNFDQFIILLAISECVMYGIYLYLAIRVCDVKKNRVVI